MIHRRKEKKKTICNMLNFLKKKKKASVIPNKRRLNYKSRNGRGRISFRNAKETMVRYSGSLGKRGSK